MDVYDNEFSKQVYKQRKIMFIANWLHSWVSGQALLVDINYEKKIADWNTI